MDSIMVINGDVTDYGHWAQATHTDMTGRYHRFTAHRLNDSLWSITEESFRAFVTDYEYKGTVKEINGRNEALAFLRSPSN